MERIEIKTSLTLADWQAYQAHWVERNLGGQHGQGFIAAVIAAAIVGAGAALADHFGWQLSWPSLVIGIGLGTALTIYNSVRARRASRPDPDSLVLGPSSIVFTATGIDAIRNGSLGRYSWSLVKDLAWTDQHLFVWLDKMAALIVPLRDLPAGLDVRQLGAAIRALRGADTQRTTGFEPLLPEAPPTVPPEQAQLAAQEAASMPGPLERFLRAYGRLLLGRASDANDLAIPARRVLLLPAVGLALWLILDRLRAGAGAEFYPYAVFAWSWYTVIVLGSVWAASRLARPHVAYDRLLVIAVASAPVVLALELAQDRWVRPDWVFVTSLAIAIYAAVYVSAALHSLTGRRQARAVWMFAVIVCVAVSVTQTMYFGGRFWYANEEFSGEDGSDYWADMQRSEALMYAQPQRIAAAVQALQRPDGIPAAAFFVGFAGQGEQRVFAGEIALARKVVAARFGSAQRSVLLVNDRRDLDTLPLASPTALRYALDGIAARMRPESDVLFVALSSHGSKDGEIAVSNGMLALNDLSADDLATALRESRIKWKVVIVSACYAGKFIEPLRDDNTIVIAAAAADRTSFGCSDDRDLTYFGEAFYRDGLPTASDLKTAFEKASAAIAARERAERKTASNPQAHFGKALVEHLDSAFPGT
jgi:hypothetical protein